MTERTNDRSGVPWGVFDVDAVGPGPPAPSMRHLPNLTSRSRGLLCWVKFTQTGATLADAAEAAILLVEPHGYQLTRVEKHR